MIATQTQAQTGLAISGDAVAFASLRGVRDWGASDAIVNRLTNISKTSDGGRSYAERDLSLEVRDDETLVLLGPSGCGKTTTLKMVNRLIEPTSGRVFGL